MAHVAEDEPTALRTSRIIQKERQEDVAPVLAAAAVPRRHTYGMIELQLRLGAAWRSWSGGRLL